MKGAIAWWLFGVWCSLVAAAFTPEVRWEALTVEPTQQQGTMPQLWTPVRKLT